MSHRVIFVNAAIRDLRRLDRQIADRIVGAIARFAETGYGDVRRLQGETGQLAPLALRVGDWRVWFDVDDDAGTMTVLRVRHRSDAYR